MTCRTLRIHVNEEYGYRDWIIFMTEKELLHLVNNGGTIPAAPIDGTTLFFLRDNHYLDGVLYTELGNEDHDNLLVLGDPHKDSRHKVRRIPSPPLVGIHCYQPPIKGRNLWNRCDDTPDRWQWHCCDEFPWA